MQAGDGEVAKLRARLHEAETTSADLRLTLRFNSPSNFSSAFLPRFLPLLSRSLTHATSQAFVLSLDPTLSDTTHFLSPLF